ncbi:MAG TPA: hypothetical protein VM370_01230 [Candidatus Thermoplasmatota archaeon]|nr:hypothetical protein [Candidatus Thermoplasmatota archaeon]
MTQVETIPAIYAKIENRPGSLEQIARVFGEKRINIDCISSETVGSTGFVRVLTPRAKEVVDALRHVRIECYESQVVVAPVPNRPGELARVCGDIAATGINVESCFTTADGKLAFRTSDNERCAQLLRKM